MLIDVLQKINRPLSKNDLAEILFTLIYSKSQDRLRTKIEPYNQLKPLLNEQYTLVFIKSFAKNQDIFGINEICGILVHLYRYSHVSNYSDIACLQLQPHVTVNIDKDGKYYIIYETFDTVKKKERQTYMNDFKYITDPIEYFEKPCIVDIRNNEFDFYDIEKLYSYEKCDQYMAFQIMLAENSSSDNNIQEKQSPANLAKVSSQLSKNILTKPYLMGYYYYKVGLSKGEYLFDKKNGK